MMDVIGSKQLSVLQIVSRQGGNAYGASIFFDLEEDGEKTALPQLYLILEKLLRKKLVKSRIGEAGNKRGARRRKLYTITGEGQRVLRECLNTEPRLKSSKGWISIGGETPS